MRPVRSSRRDSKHIPSLTEDIKHAVAPTKDEPISPSRDDSTAATTAETAPATKKGRFRISDCQLQQLEMLFKQQTHPSRGLKQALADAIGMDFKSVTIWFQNRRQTSRRRSSKFIEITSAITPPPDFGQESIREDTLSQPANALVLTVGLQGSALRARHVEFYTPSGISTVTPKFTSPQPQSETEKQKLCIDRLSSPVASLRTLSPVPPNLIKDEPSDDFDSLQTSPLPMRSAKRRWSLDWYCEQKMKRRRLDKIDVQESFSDADVPYDTEYDSTEDEAGEDVDEDDKLMVPRTRVTPPAHSGVTDVPVVPVVTRSSRPRIPPSLHGIFSPDVILGASLLLDFKYSTETLVDSDSNKL
ncbi:uncharacterized protein FIBRA_05242 [Fibroporia radiculosa]|uniref:Homeobox domain-containing protein n=1 Tax=Fibroporia radiculosa TaxID=599839 RepID=J4IAL5_9APHY|nr:uncharacterized protein FIBRA_05242 [Fibroporia radiculosa]CCM03121.1 predicted protein [Fibroporia radiculosa]